MKGQMNFEDYIKQVQGIRMSCEGCLCQKCLYYHSGRCPHGKCYDDRRAEETPYDKLHPHQPPRRQWSNWNKPKEQAHWCRGGFFYHTTYCSNFVKFLGCTVKECLKANVTAFQDGYIACSLIDTFGCEKCYQEFEDKNR